MTRPLAAFLLAALFLIPPAQANPRVPLDRPNLIVILTGLSGPEIPEFASLAASGATFERFYISPQRAPTRAAILTGRHYVRAGVLGNDKGNHILHEAEITLAEILAPLDYRTGFFGPWLNGANFPHNASGQGFERASKPEDAIEFIQLHQSKPFFCIVALGPGLDSARQMVESLTAELDRLSLRKNTVILVTADRQTSGDAPRPGAGLYGSGDSLHEGSLRVPCIMSWPDVIPQGTVIREIARDTDLLPTLADMAGAEMPTGRTYDGLSLVPLLLWTSTDRWPNRNLYSVRVKDRDLRNIDAAVRTNRWLAVKDRRHRRTPVGEDGEEWELYDLTADPYQNYDVAGFYPYVLALLKSDFSQWYRDATTFGFKPVPIELGHEGWPVVTLLPKAARLETEPSSFNWLVEAVTEATWEASLTYRSPGKAGVSLGTESGAVDIRADLPASDQWTSLTVGELRIPRENGRVTLKFLTPENGFELRSLRLKRQ